MILRFEDMIVVGDYLYILIHSQNDDLEIFVILILHACKRVII